MSAFGALGAARKAPGALRAGWWRQLEPFSAFNASPSVLESVWNRLMACAMPMLVAVLLYWSGVVVELRWLS